MLPTVSPAVAGILSIAGGAFMAVLPALGAVPPGSSWTVYAGAAGLALAGYFHLNSPPQAGPLQK